MNKNREEENKKINQEIEMIFEEGKKALLSLHKQKMLLIDKFKEAKEVKEADDILQKIKDLQ